jgi:hypothetical protein
MFIVSINKNKINNYIASLIFLLYKIRLKENNKLTFHMGKLAPQSTTLANFANSNNIT